MSVSFAAPRRTDQGWVFDSDAGYKDDLFGSAAVGLGWSYVCYHPRLMGTLFDKMEPEKNPRRRRLQREPKGQTTTNSDQQSVHAA